VGNGTAIKVFGAFSKPQIIGNTLQKNKEAAMMIASGAQPVLARIKFRIMKKKGSWFRFQHRSSVTI